MGGFSRVEFQVGFGSPQNGGIKINDRRLWNTMVKTNPPPPPFGERLCHQV